MSENELKCLSCKKSLTNESGVARFLCPKCGQYEIIRCRGCRSTASKYKCPNCNFIGPN